MPGLPLLVKVLLQGTFLHLESFWFQHHFTLEQFFVAALGGSGDGRVWQMDLGSQNGVGVVMTQHVEAAKRVWLSRRKAVSRRVGLAHRART